VGRTGTLLSPDALTAPANERESSSPVHPEVG
jgi:hypothetical protein